MEVEIWSPQVGVWKWAVRWYPHSTYRAEGVAWTRKGAIRKACRKRRNLQERDEWDKEKLARIDRTLEKVDC